MPASATEAAEDERGEHVRRERQGSELRGEYRLAKLQKQTAEEQLAIYENRINLLQQRKTKALTELGQAAKRQEQRAMLRQKAEEEAVERHRHREENRERFEKQARAHKDMVENSRALAQMRRMQTLERNRAKVESVRQEKHAWREMRSEMAEKESALAKSRKESVQASEREAKGNKERARASRIEGNRDRMRQEIGDYRKTVRNSTRLIGQYAEIERNLIDFVQSTEEQQELRELELHEYICTCPSTRVDRIACGLAGRGSGGYTDRSALTDFGYATVGSTSFEVAARTI